MKPIGLHHTSYSVSNLERSLAFYVDLLGCEVIWQREIREGYFGAIVGFPGCVVKAAHLRIPGSDHVLELFEYVSPPGQAVDMSTNRPGSSHMCFVVDDLPAYYQELQAKGARFRSPPVEIDAGVNRGAYCLYLLDPDGIAVELLQRANPEDKRGVSNAPRQP
jgi:catechol 2,3-dioxygenase-like lactoylglutathione lyase family enzyme